MNSQFLIPGRRAGGNTTIHDHGTDGGGRGISLRLSPFTDFALRIGISSPLGVKVSPVSEPYVVHKGPNHCSGTT